MRGVTLPGGHIGSNETPVLAAARELEEEVGLVVAPAEIRFFGRMELRHTRLSLFECQLAREPEIRIDNREVTAAAFTAPAAISEPSSTLRRYLRAHGLESAVPPAGGVGGARKQPCWPNDLIAVEKQQQRRKKGDHQQRSVATPGSVTT